LNGFGYRHSLLKEIPNLDISKVSTYITLNNNNGTDEEIKPILKRASKILYDQIVSKTFQHKLSNKKGDLINLIDINFRVICMPSNTSLLTFKAPLFGDTTIMKNGYAEFYLGEERKIITDEHRKTLYNPTS